MYEKRQNRHSSYLANIGRRRMKELVDICICTSKAKQILQHMRFITPCPNYTQSYYYCLVCTVDSTDKNSRRRISIGMRNALHACDLDIGY